MKAALLGSQPRAESERLREGTKGQGLSLVIAWSKSWLSRGSGTTEKTTGLSLPIVYCVCIVDTSKVVSSIFNACSGRNKKKEGCLKISV